MHWLRLMVEEKGDRFMNWPGGNDVIIIEYEKEGAGRLAQFVDQVGQEGLQRGWLFFIWLSFLFPMGITV